MHIQFNHKRRADLTNVLVCGIYEAKGQKEPIAENALEYPVSGDHGLARRMMLKWASKWAKVNADRLKAFQVSVDRMLGEAQKEKQGQNGQILNG